MPDTKGQTIKRELTSVVDDIFDVFEQVRTMLRGWHSGYHMPFINQVMRLQKLEVELYALGYDEIFVLTVKKAVYHSVFFESEWARISVNRGNP